MASCCVPGFPTIWKNIWVQETRLNNSRGVDVEAGYVYVCQLPGTRTLGPMKIRLRNELLLLAGARPGG